MIIATSSPKKFKIGAFLIEQYQHTNFSHVLIIKDDLVFQASHGYVNCTHIDNFIEENNIINFFEIPDQDVDMDFVKKQLGKKYGFLQLINISTRYLLGIQIFSNDNNQRFICSEYVGKALNLPWVNDSTTPIEIYNYLRNKYGNS